MGFYGRACILAKNKPSFWVQYPPNLHVRVLLEPLKRHSKLSGALFCGGSARQVYLPLRYWYFETIPHETCPLKRKFIENLCHELSLETTLS